MAKRYGDSTYGVGTKVKKRKGIKIRAVNVPESDDEATPLNVDTEYARLLKTRVSVSGKVGSVTMNTLPVFEVKDIVHTDAFEPVIYDNDGITAGNVALVIKAKRRRKKANDSVRHHIFTY